MQSTETKIDNTIQESESEPELKLDYSIDSPEERVALVKKIIEHTEKNSPNKLTNRYL